MKLFNNHIKDNSGPVMLNQQEVNIHIHLHVNSDPKRNSQKSKSLFQRISGWISSAKKVFKLLNGNP